MGNDFEIVLPPTIRGPLAVLQARRRAGGAQGRGLEEFGRVESPVEDGATLAENARLKARHYSQALNRVVLADDSGLEVEALSGEPGVHSARYSGGEWPNHTEQDRANIQKLLEVMSETPRENRQARFCCCLCLVSGVKILLEVEGYLEGYIAQQPRGNNGFGYDPVFSLPERNKTVAELSPKEKNAISHRGQALRMLMARWKEIEF